MEDGLEWSVTFAKGQTMKATEIEVSYYTKWEKVTDSRIAKDKDGKPVLGPDGKPTSKSFETLKPVKGSQKTSKIKAVILESADIQVSASCTRTLNELGIGTNNFAPFFNRGLGLYLCNLEKAKQEKAAGKPVVERAAKAPVIPQAALDAMSKLANSQDPAVVAMLAAMRAAGIKV